MSKIIETTSKKYNPNNLLVEGTSPDITWTEWNNQSGTNVQAFIKGALEDAIVDFRYEDQVLYGVNGLGEDVARAEVTVVKPTYTFNSDETTISITVGNTLVTGETLDVNATSSLKVTAEIHWNLVQSIGDKTNNNAVNAVSYRVYLVDSAGDKNSSNGTELTGTASSKCTLDISKLFSEIDSGNVRVKAELSYDFIGDDQVIRSVSSEITSETLLNIKKIILSYSSNKDLLRSTELTFDITGITSDEYSSYKLYYRTIGNSGTITSDNTFQNLTSASSANLDISAYISKKVQPVSICARVCNDTKTLYSDWITVDVLYQTKDINEGATGASVAITNIPETVSNCDSANLFDVLTTSKLSGDITVYIFKDTVESTLQNITTTGGSNNYAGDKMATYLFKTVNISLNGTQDSSTNSYYSYLELDNVNSDNNTIYLAFVVKDSAGATVSKFCQYNGNNVVVKTTRKITITNPSNASELKHVATNKIIDYSQISFNNTFIQNSTQTTLFNTSNLHENIDSTDGMTQDGKYMGFKVSPLGTTQDSDGNTTPINLFKTAIDLQTENGTSLPSNNRGFSIELLLKTYNVNNDDDFILSMGNLRLYPHYLRLWDASEGKNADGSTNLASVYEASCANFSKDEITHIMITFDPAYLPSQYKETIYNELYPGYDKTSADNGPSGYQCLKIYVNGVINRSVTINRANLFDSNNKFSLQIHPTNSNINIYGFRTYSKCLNYSEIQLNKISSLVSLSDKNSFLDLNDVLYKASDYTTARWAELTKAHLDNTISIRKCLNSKDSGYANKNKEYTPKNVMLIVTGDEGPLYYGNKKFKDPNNSNKKTKYHDAAMFIKYAHNKSEDANYANEYNGKFIGIYQAHENGYAEYYKAQGSSAKRYGGAYNVQFSKFYFIPESKLSLFSDLVDNKLYDENAGSTWKETSTVTTDGNSETTYSTNVKFEFNQYLQENTAEKYPKTYNKAMESCGAKKAYILPTEKAISENPSECKKLVGKVNYASSMQSHKQGACDLYAINYPDVGGDYMKRRAVKEDVFYYFYVKLSDCQTRGNSEEVTFRNITWDDIPLDKVRFFGIQTWGSAKMDKATFGLDSDHDLEYLNIEGADNKNSSTNFKCPWAASQIWGKDKTEQDNPYYTAIAYHPGDPAAYVEQYAGYDTVNGKKVPNYIKNILIDDETLRYKKPSNAECGSQGADAIEKGPDSWDIAGNAVEETESSHYEFIKWGEDFTDTAGVAHKAITPIENSFNSFAKFYNYIYTFDFGNLELFGDSEKTEFTLSNSEDTSKKYVMAFGGTLKTSAQTYTVQPGDVFRWDQLFEKFVPAGLYYDEKAKEWETFNLGKVYQQAVKAINEEESDYLELYQTAAKNFDNYKGGDTLFDKPESLITMDGDTPMYLNADSDNVYTYLGDDSNRDEYFKKFRGAFADMFKCVIWAYCDVNSFAYHQAAIRFLSGTDNRAKNIYFVLKGSTYKAEEAIDAETGAPKTYYVKDNVKNSEYSNRYLWTLFQDDLDTIFATDNNGQQAKAYNLLEPIFNNETMTYWGDSRSGLWYNFDLVFADEIKKHLSRIVKWAINDGTVYDTTNELYKSFLKIQNEDIPAVVYNHMSEIYYDVMQTVYKGGDFTTFGKTLESDYFKDFNNNLVSNPESLVHGGCFESEKQFLKKRVALLASYCAEFTSEDAYSKILPQANSAGGASKITEVNIKQLSFIQDFYPKINNVGINDSNKENRSYADPFVLEYAESNIPEYIKALAREGDKYDFKTDMTSSLTTNEGINHTDYFKTATFTKGVSALQAFAMNNIAELAYELPEDSTLGDAERGINFVPVNEDTSDEILYMHKIIKNVEILKAPYSKFTKSIIDFSSCQRLQELDLTESAKFENILLPKSNKLSKVILPSSLSKVTIEYYPGITALESEDCWFKFDKSDVKLTSITIDLNNTWALEFIEKYAKSGIIKNIVFKNIPDTLDINSTVLYRILECPDFSFEKKVTLHVTDTMTMDLKAKMAKKWGDIDNKNNNQVYCTYTVVSANSVSFPDTSPVVNSTNNTVAFDVVDSEGNPANDIDIQNQSLRISYKLSNWELNDQSTSDPGIKINSTGEFTFKDGISLTGLTATLTVTVTLTGGRTVTNDVDVSFGAFIPKAGDIVYSDGSISRAYNTSKTPIGFIFWAKTLEETDSTQTMDLRVLAFDSIAGDDGKGLPFGPSNAYSSESTNLQAWETLNKPQQTNIEKVFKNKLPGYFGEISKVAATKRQELIPDAGTMYVTPASSANLTSLTKDSEITTSQNLYCGEYFTETIHDFVYKSMYDMIKQAGFSSFSTSYANLNPDNYDDMYENYFQGNSTPALRIGQILFPAYVKTWEWCPAGVDASNTEIGINKWYIPSLPEYSYLIVEKLKQSYNSNDSASSPNYWQKKAEDTFFDRSNTLRKDTSDNIFKTLLTNMGATSLASYSGLVSSFGFKFLGELTLIKSSTFKTLADENKNIVGTVGDDDNNVYIYSLSYQNSTYSYSSSWTYTYNYYRDITNVLLSQPAIVYPCCRIKKIINLMK